MLTDEEKQQVDVDGETKYAPCSPGDPEAQEMTFTGLKDNEIAVPLVELRDVVKALKNSTPTSNTKSLGKYAEWADAREID